MSISSWGISPDFTRITPLIIGNSLSAATRKHTKVTVSSQLRSHWRWVIGASCRILFQRFTTLLEFSPESGFETKLFWWRVLLPCSWARDSITSTTHLRNSVIKKSFEMYLLSLLSSTNTHTSQYKHASPHSWSQNIRSQNSRSQT